MIRVLVVVTPDLLDEPLSSAVPRALRDAGHEVVHAGSLSPEQAVAAAVQEDVDAIALVVMSSDTAERTRLEELLAAAGAPDIGISVVEPGLPAREVVERAVWAGSPPVSTDGATSS